MKHHWEPSIEFCAAIAVIIGMSLVLWWPQ